MFKKIFYGFILSLIFFPPILAKDINFDKLKEEAKKLKTGSSSSNQKIDDIVVEPPKSRFIDTAPKTLSIEDERHIRLHMKLANRYFSKKNYEKAIEEVNTVFQRDPAHSGGHFMSAVIAGRKKEHKTAWYHISIAKEKDSSNKKIDDFITKLKTVSSEPKSPEWITGIYNGIEQDASERTFDSLEKLLSDECSQNITNISSEDYKADSNGGSSVSITFKARESFDSDKIYSLFKNLHNLAISTGGKSNNEITINIIYAVLKPIKPNVKSIKGINDFINDLTEDFPDIAISNTEEAEPKNGNQEIIYEISAREFSSINQFMRRISPFATKYILQNMELAYIPGSQSTIWKAKIKVIYKV